MKQTTIATLIAYGLILGIAIGVMLSPLRMVAGKPQVTEWLEVVHRVCTSIGGLGTFVTLIFVGRQFQLLRTQSELVQKNVVASMDSVLYSRLDSFNRFIVEHHAVYDLLRSPFNAEEPMEDRAKLHRLCDLGFTFYEEIFKHRVRYKLLDNEDWDEWHSSMAHFFAKPYVQGYWNTVSNRFAKSFQPFVADLIQKLQVNQEVQEYPTRNQEQEMTKGQN